MNKQKRVGQVAIKPCGSPHHAVFPEQLHNHQGDAHKEFKHIRVFIRPAPEEDDVVAQEQQACEYITKCACRMAAWQQSATEP